MTEVQKRVFESLDRALSEGYENVLSNSAAETAAEIGEYDRLLAEIPTTAMVPCVQAWLDAKHINNFYSAVTGKPVPTLARAINDLLDTILCGDLLNTHSPENVAMHLVRTNPTTLFGHKQRTYEEIIPHVRSWFKKHGRHAEPPAEERHNKLWLLQRPRKSLDRDCDTCDGFVIASPDSASARALASKNAADELAVTWTDPAMSTCTCIADKTDLPESIVLRDARFH